MKMHQCQPWKKGGKCIKERFSAYMTRMTADKSSLCLINSIDPLQSYSIDTTSSSLFSLHYINKSLWWWRRPWHLFFLGFVPNDWNVYSWSDVEKQAVNRPTMQWRKIRIELGLNKNVGQKSGRKSLQVP